MYISRFIFFLLFVCVFVFVAFFFSFLDLSFSLKRAHQLLWAAVWFVWSKITMQLLLFDARNTDISKIMWSEVKKNSRNKFLTINKNNEVHLFDLNSFYVYFVLSLSPSFSCCCRCRYSFVFVFFFISFARIHRIAAFFLSLYYIVCFHAGFSFEGKNSHSCTSRCKPHKKNNNGKNLRILTQFKAHDTNHQK